MAKRSTSSAVTVSTYGSTVDSDAVKNLPDRVLEEVASRILLAMLQRGAWRTIVKSASETEKVNAAHGTVDEAKVTVTQCKLKALHDTYSLLDSAYNAHKKITMPSVQDSVRVVIAGKEFAHADALREYHEQIGKKIEELVDAGCYRGGAEFHRQKKALGALFEEKAWPYDENDLRSRFKLKSTYLKCPTDGAWAEWIGETYLVSRNYIEDQFVAALKKVTERCAGTLGDGSTGRLHESVFRNLEAVIETLSTLDVENHYETVIEKAKEISKYRAEEIRKDPDTRSDLAKRADDLTDMFAALRG